MWHHFSQRAAEVSPQPEILHITILMLSEERYFQFLPLQLVCRVYGASCCILFSSRVWFILLSEGQTWNSVALLEVFIGWEIIYSLIFKVNQIAQFNYRNNVAKDAVISVLWLILSAFSVDTCLRCWISQSFSIFPPKVMADGGICWGLWPFYCKVLSIFKP